MAAGKRYRVAAGTQVNHAGKLYTAGQTLEAPESDAREWLARGYVAEVKRKR